tara:strand:- start:3235 stop:3831 length:597 start_codon:yes stop_codon:yes gene_type:complete
MAFKLPKLNYAYDALEPHIDSRTMEIHHSKHHAGYTNNLNKAIEGTELETKTIEEIMKLPNLPNNIRNNGGGYFNHCLFWDILSPKKIVISKEFGSIIDENFGSISKMKEEFKTAAASRFGSGWAWLCSNKGKLEICSTPNQDNPLMDSKKNCVPVLGLDVWEHAYYLLYQNRRPDYIEAFWEIVNWSSVESRYKASI